MDWGFCILPDCICLQQCPTQVEASYYLIEVSWVNVVYLIHTSSLWLCDVKSPCRLTRSPPCLEWLHPGVDKAWNVRGGGELGTFAKGLFPLWKAHIDFHSEAKSVTSPLCHSFAVYFAPLIPRAGWHEKSIAWELIELCQGIIYCKVLSIKLYKKLLTKFRIKHFETIEILYEYIL